MLALAGYAGPGSGVALAAGYAPVAAIALAEEGRLTQPQAGIVPQPDRDVELLLNRLLHQLASGRTSSPEGDNAMATWKILLDAVIPPTPGTAKAMTTFVREAHRRAAEEEAAGRLRTAMDLTLFASEASDILEGERGAPPPVAMPAYRPERDTLADLRLGGAASPAEPPPPAVPMLRPRTEASVPAEPPRTQAAGKAPTGSPVPPASRATPNATDSSAPLAAAPPSQPVPPQTGPDRARTAAAVGRGDAMLAMKDISAARALYEYAANAGSAQGARALAETYDPGFLRRLGVIGPRPDVALAAAWYRKAAALGDTTAEAKVRTLAAEAAR